MRPTAPLPRARSNTSSGGLLVLLALLLAPTVRSAPTLEAVLQGGHAGAVSCLAVSPDGAFLASGGADRTVRIWDTRGGRLFRELDCAPEGVVHACFVAEGRLLVTAGPEGPPRVWDPVSGRVVRRLQGAHPRVQALASRGSMLALAGGDPDAGTVQVIDATTGTSTCTLHARGAFRDVAFSPDGTEVAVALRPERPGTDLVEIFDARAGTLARVLRGDRVGAECVAWSSDGRLVAAGTLDHTVEIWDASTTIRVGAVRPQAADPAAEAPASDVSFSPDGHVLLATAGGAVQQWRLSWNSSGSGAPGLAGAPLPQFPTAGGAARCAMIGPGGTWMAAGLADGRVFVCDAAGALRRVLPAERRLVPSARWLADGTLALSAHGTASPIEVGAWDASSTRLRTMATPDDAVALTRIDPAGRILAGATEHAALLLWDADQGTLLRQLGGHQAPVTAMAFSADGRRLATGGADRAVCLWDVGAGTRLHQLFGHSGAVLAVALSPDGRLLATGGADHEVRVWSTDTGNLQLEFHAPDEIAAVAFPPAGDSLACAAGSRVLVWDLRSGGNPQVWEGFDAPVTCVAFAPGGVLAAGTASGLATVFALQGGVPPVRLAPAGGRITEIGFSPGGTRVFTASADRVTRLWNVREGRLLVSLTTAASEGKRAWVALGPDGSFAGEGTLSEILCWRSGSGTLPFEAARDRYRPGLLEELRGR